ncbi:MAG: DUF6797 domain-containing protein [Balneolales bacterium]
MSSVIRYTWFTIFTCTIILFIGCSKEHITEVDFEQVEFAPFVERDFPFITTSLDAGGLGSGFSSDNVTARCLAVQLENDMRACFDTDLLRWSVAWMGDSIPLGTMAQVSYHNFYNKSNIMPKLEEEPVFATGLYPGWMGSQLDFTDPRPPGPNSDDPSWGPLPDHLGRWNGLYVIDQNIVLAYRVRNANIYELPGSITVDSEVGFTRSIRAEQRDEPITMVVADISNGMESEVADNVAYIYSETNADTVTAIGLIGSGVELRVLDHRFATVNIPSGEENITFKTVAWRGPVTRVTQFQQMLTESIQLPDFQKGGPSHWPETVYTRGALSPDTSAYVTDQLTLPIPNPWDRNVRAIDVDFFNDNRAAVVTFDGDVWIVDGINHNLKSLKWRRFASGIYEPQSIEVVDDNIYVYGREGILRLNDLNNDGEADFYENFSNLMAQSIESREWPSDMVEAPEGGFYIAKGAALDNGPPTSEPIISGFRAGAAHSGSILKISPDGRSINLIATGFRGPYLGIHPETGVLTASDQQGNFVPSTPLFIVKEGDYFGVPATAHRDPIPEITPPLNWIPHNVDQSSMSQVWITSDEMGPLNGDLINLSYGRPGVFKVLIDSTENTLQGGVSYIQSNYPAPTMKGALNPGDGQLYISGITLWGSRSKGVSALTRLRYTGLPSTLPEGFKARDGGLIIDFDVELDEEMVSDPQNYRVERWNYQRTDEYGSGHFKLDGTPGQEYLPVTSAHLSDNGQSILLAVPNIKEVMQMQITYQLETNEGVPFSGVLPFTVHVVSKIDFEAEGFSGAEAYIHDEGALVSEIDTQEPATAARGKELFMQRGCIACHSIDGSTAGFTGPSLAGIFGSERPLDDGSTVTADEEYLRISILQPGEDIVDGYEQGMPSFNGILSEDEIESIILYIMTISD